MASRPVVALDIDGVLNPDKLMPGYETHHVTVPAIDVPNSPFVSGGGKEPLQLQVRTWSVHRDWILSLTSHADVVWATTWEQAANKVYGPLLGVGPFSLGTSVEDTPPKFGQIRSGDVDGWKAMALDDNFHGTPLVWVDDNAYKFDGELYDWDAPSLVIVPDPATGLTVAHMAKIDEFLANLDS
jgi:hypothetical protein